jgi:molybdenum cofactor cytidylyltransferase
MSRSPSFAGVILAAGESSRMGRDKALLPWPPDAFGRASSSDTFLSCTIRSMSRSTDFVIVVAGRNQAALAPIVYASGESMVVNSDPDRGQFSSLQIGLQEVLNRGRDAAVVTLVDRPPVGANTIELLRTALASAPSDIWAAVPEFSGKHGHPYIVGRELIEIFLQAPPTASARDFEHQYRDHIQYVVVDDPFVALNVNTPQDYAALLEKSAI